MLEGSSEAEGIATTADGGEDSITIAVGVGAGLQPAVFSFLMDQVRAIKSPGFTLLKALSFPSNFVVLLSLFDRVAAACASRELIVSQRNIDPKTLNR